MLEKIMIKSRFAEESVLNQVLIKLLNREPTDEDWGRFEIIEKIDERHSYFLLYNNESIGVIQKQIAEKDFVWTLTVTFTPTSDLN